MIKKMTESVHNFAEGKSVTLNSGLNVREELGTSDQDFFFSLPNSSGSYSVSPKPGHSKSLRSAFLCPHCSLLGMTQAANSTRQCYLHQQELAQVTQDQYQPFFCQRGHEPLSSQAERERLNRSASIDRNALFIHLSKCVYLTASAATDTALSTTAESLGVLVCF